MDVFRKTPERN